MFSIDFWIIAEYKPCGEQKSSLYWNCLFSLVVHSLRTMHTSNWGLQQFWTLSLSPFRCSTGYHGNPRMPGGRCEECKCSLWGALPGPCDPVTGQCRCRVGASGRSCDQCMDRHVCGPAGIICKTNTQLFVHHFSSRLIPVAVPLIVICWYIFCQCVL